MYDCNGPCLVFVTQTFHPLLNSHSGYIFAEYDFLYTKPRELFFSTIAEAQIYALKRGTQLTDARESLEVRGMALHMHPDAKPERISSLAYLTNFDLDDSRFHDMGRPSPSEPSELRRKSRQVAIPREPVGELGDVDFFGGVE